MLACYESPLDVRLDMFLEIRDADAMTEIAEAFQSFALIFPEDEQWPDGYSQIIQVNRWCVKRVHACAGSIAADVNVVDILCTPDKADIAHIWSCTTIRATCHTHAQWFICES